MQQFVRIVNRNTYTNPKKALLYVERGLAAVVACSDSGGMTEIRMLEAAEIAISKTALRRFRETDPVKGSFEWIVTDSGGSRLMREYEGVSGGTRGFQAIHGN